MTLTLRKKTLSVVTLTLIALIVILYFAISTVVGNSFSETEEKFVRLNVERVNEALDNELGKMDNTLRVEARAGQVLNLERFASLLENEATKFSPKAENKLAELIADQNNNLWLFTDSSDKIIWGQGYDEETKKVTPVPDSFQDLLTPDSPLLRHPDRDTTLKGMIILPEGSMLVVSVAVLNQKSDGTIEER